MDPQTLHPGRIVKLDPNVRCNLLQGVDLGLYFSQDPTRCDMHTIARARAVKETAEQLRRDLYICH